MRKKRFLAVTLSAAMIMSSSVAAFASSTSSVTPQRGSATGSGTVEGWVDTDVFSVQLPTVETRGSGIGHLDFFLDPQGLIEATSGNKYTSSNTTYNKGVTGVSGNYGTLYFTKKTSSNTLLSQESDPLTVVNKGAVSVNVELAASINNAGGITISDNAPLKEGTTSMYLELQGDGQTPVAITEKGVSMEAEVSGCNSSFGISYNASQNKYEYKVASANDVDYPEFSFNLEGACSTGGDWTKAVSANPTVSVAWKVTPLGYVDPTPRGPAIKTQTYKLSAGQDVVVKVDLGYGEKKATNIARIGNVAVGQPLGTNLWSFDTKRSILTIKSTFTDNIVNNTALESGATRELNVVFNSTPETQVKIKLVK